MEDRKSREPQIDDDKPRDEVRAKTFSSVAGLTVFDLFKKKKIFVFHSFIPLGQ